MSREDLYEKYLLVESKNDFLSSLIPDSEDANYFTVLHELNSQGKLSEVGLAALQKLKDKSTAKNQGYGLHNLDFLRVLSVLNSSESSSEQKSNAISDLKNYLQVIKFNAVKPPDIKPKALQVLDQKSPQQKNKLNSVLDEKIFNFQNYLNQAYTSLTHLQNIAPQYLNRIDPNRLLSETSSSKDFHKFIDIFLSNVPCLHQMKDVPQIYNALYLNFVSRKQIYEFSQYGYDRLSLVQLQELGSLMKGVVFDTSQYQLALIKKLFYKDLIKFQGKKSNQLSNQEKAEKKKLYTVVKEWCRINLPLKLSFLTRQIGEEIILLNSDLCDYDQEAFIEYLNNPPSLGQIFLEQRRKKFASDSVKSDYIWSNIFQFQNIDQGRQNQLIEEYLIYFLKSTDSLSPFDTYFSEKYLHQTQYKAKILNGNQEYISKAGPVLPKFVLDSLLNERSITIQDKNERYISGNGEVSLQVEVKNIQNLVVNIFEVKTENYYLTTNQQFDNKINLDGLVPINTFEYSYKEPANQLVVRSFNLEPIQKAQRGIFIVEFFGNSISSRAVIKKGLLTLVQTPTIAGHLICIVDEQQQICKPTNGGKTGIWHEGRFHSSNADGQIIIPYQSYATNSQVILVHDDFSELQSLSILTEDYSFQCTYIFNQESFLQGSKAKVIIKPSLYLNGVAANMQLIEEQVIKVSILNRQDIPATLEFRDIKYDSQNDIEIEIPVQSIIKSVDIDCSGLIKKMNGTSQNLNNQKQLSFNLHDIPINQIFNIYLQQNTSQGYVVMVLDKTGQPIEGVPIQFQFTHRRIKEILNASLQTDENGKIILGLLENITSISAKVPEFNNFPGINQNWNIHNLQKVELPSSIIITEGELIEVPLTSETNFSKDAMTFYSINQVKGQDFVYEDLFNVLQKEGDYIKISNLKEGMYVLNLLEDNQVINIQVYKGKYWSQNSSYLVADNTFIPVQRQKSMLISIKEALLVPQSEKEADILVNLNLPHNFSSEERKKLRVHVFGYNFYSNQTEKAVENLRSSRIHASLQGVDLRSYPANFFNNKKIGDEICYVLQRKGQQKLIGNTLEKPCILLKRTLNRDTQFENEQLASTQAYSSSSTANRECEKDMRMMDKKCKRMAVRRSSAEVFQKKDIDSFLNFLNHPCFISSNNNVNEDGKVIVSGFQWNNYSSIQVLVASDSVAISDIFSTSQAELSTQDLRHVSSMKPDELYTENLSYGKLSSGEQLLISADSSTAIVGSLPELFEIQKVLMKTGRRSDLYFDQSYSIWSFLKEWASFTDRQKLEKYNEYASHELNLFLYFKDESFFKTVVLPFIRNKLNKTFVDLFLLDSKKELLEFAKTERVEELNILEQTLLISALVSNNLKQRAQEIANSIENNYKVLSKNLELKKRLILTIIESSAKDEVKAAHQKVQEESVSMLMMNSAQPIRVASRQLAQAPVMKMMMRMEEQLESYVEEDYDHDMKGRIGDVSCMKFDESNIMEQRKEFKQGYKKLEKTVEYIERNYYNDKNGSGSSYLQSNLFWVDLAKYLVENGTFKNFVSQNFIFSFNNHVESIAVLAFMDISFTPRGNYDLNNQPGRKILLSAKKSVLYFSKEIIKSESITKANVSIIQTFFNPNDRFTTLKDDPTIRIEKEVDEFIINKIYGTKVIITNTSIANFVLQVLSEIPEGSLPVNSFEYTRAIDVTVNSYQTVSCLEYYFYFPKPGNFSVYRSNASRNGSVVAQASQIPQIEVKAYPQIIKMENLSDILNHGSTEDILKFAKTQNLKDQSSFSFSKIYYILQSDKQFFLDFLNILREQGIFDSKVWTHSLVHNDEQSILELLNNKSFRTSYFNYPYHKIYDLNGVSLSINEFQAFEYHPLLTSRVHSFMDENKKRIDDSLKLIKRLESVSLEGESQIQRDYLSAYLNIYTGGPNFKLAREISEQYLEYPIISWRNLFINLNNQLTEYDGASVDESEKVDSADLSTNLQNAEKEQQVNMEIVGKQLAILHQNTDNAEINFYQLDLEILFSTSPFLQGGDHSEFTFVKPNHTIKLALGKSASLEKQIIDIPSALATKNLYIQLVSPNGVQSLSYFSASLKVQILEKYGQVKVMDESNAPLQKVYVKCFSKQNDDSVIFFRDGYTDLRGRFDYALSSASDVNQVNKFSILISSEEHGAVIKEAKPPTTTGHMAATISLRKKL